MARIAYAYAVIFGVLASLASARVAQAEPEPADAQASSHRIVVVSRTNGALFARLRVELESSGWQVFAPRPASGAESFALARREIEEVAAEYHAVAVIEIDAEGTVHVWRIDEQRGGRAHSIDVVKGGADDLTALRSAEIVRIEFHGPNATEASRKDAPAPNTATPAPSAVPKLVLGLGVAMLPDTRGDIDPGWSFLAHARYRLPAGMALDGFVSVPFYEAALSGSELWAWLIGLGPTWTWVPSKGWSLYGGGGLGGAMIYRANDFNSGGSANYTLFPYGKLGATLDWSSLIGTSLQAMFGYSLVKREYSDYGDPALWGRPLTVLSITIDLHL